MRSIVVIDDSKDIHRLIRSAFTEEPWRVHSAHRGSEGLDIAASHAADLVLLDVDLPDMNGFDVCRHLKADSRTSRTSIIFLTSASASDEKICGLQLQAADYMTKPFDAQELRVRTRSALRIKTIMDMMPTCIVNFPSREDFGVPKCL